MHAKCSADEDMRNFERAAMCAPLRKTLRPKLKEVA